METKIGECKIMRKAKSCYNCIAYSVNNLGYNNAICLLGYDMDYISV